MGPGPRLNDGLSPRGYNVAWTVSCEFSTLEEWPLRALVRELFETIILTLTVFVVLQVSVQNFRVEGPSMEPTLQGDQHLLVNKLVFLRPDFGALADLLPLVSADQSAPAYAFRAPRRGDIVVFRFPGDTSRDFVKRVVGVPGDTVEIRNGEVFVNGESLHEPYVINGDSSSERPVVVPEESYYVLGDNRRASQDSRDWGTVPAENIIGRGWLRYWPLDGAQVLSSFSAQ